MISRCSPENHTSCDKNDYTIASTFEKVKTLRFKLLFGNWDREIRKGNNGDVIDVVDYYFSPQKIFGMVCRSELSEYHRFHYGFVLRACEPGEVGNVVAGVVPGAEVLVATSTSAGTAKLVSLLSALQKENVELSQISLNHYRKLNYLLEAKINTDYFVGELVREKNPL